MDYSEAAKELCLCLNEMEEVFLETENEINYLYTCSPDDIDVLSLIHISEPTRPY